MRRIWTVPNNPHFYYTPGYAAGLTRLSFDLRVEKTSVWFMEWRDKIESYIGWDRGCRGRTAN